MGNPVEVAKSLPRIFRGFEVVVVQGGRIIPFGDLGLKLKIPKISIGKGKPKVSMKRVFPEKLRKKTTALLQQHGGKLVMAVGLVATLIPVVGWIVGPLVTAGGTALDQAQQARLAARIAMKKQQALTAAKDRYENGQTTEAQYQAEVEGIAGSVAAEVLAEDAAEQKAAADAAAAPAPAPAPAPTVEPPPVKYLAPAPAAPSSGMPAWLIPAGAAAAVALFMMR
jgi:hypothetical protein